MGPFKLLLMTNYCITWRISYSDMPDGNKTPDYKADEDGTPKTPEYDARTVSFWDRSFISLYDCHLRICLTWINLISVKLYPHFLASSTTKYHNRVQQWLHPALHPTTQLWRHHVMWRHQTLLLMIPLPPPLRFVVIEVGSGRGEYLYAFIIKNIRKKSDSLWSFNSHLQFSIIQR